MIAVACFSARQRVSSGHLGQGGARELEPRGGALQVQTLLLNSCKWRPVCCPTGIQKLVLAGRVGEAIRVTQQLYPGLLEHNPNLLFVLKLVNIIVKIAHTVALPWSCPGQHLG